MYEATRQLDNFFAGISFNEAQHKYSINGTPLNPSVSTKLKKFYTPFDTRGKSLEIALRDNRPQEDILQDWKAVNQESIVRGHRVHLFAEKYAFDRSLKPDCAQEEAVVKFWQELPEWIIPIRTELMMYHKEALLPGTMDLLLFNAKKGYYIIGDYKTNLNIFNNFQGQKLLDPFSHLLDTAFNHYQIQLSYYQLLFEQTGFHIGERKIIWLCDGDYAMYDTEDFTEILKDYLY